MKELNTAVIGGVDCGKRTLLSILKTNELDDENEDNDEDEKGSDNKVMELFANFYG